jgi:polyribonucleotide 5'-hydroxyl-kinase
VRLTSGAAERDGTELALNRTYTFPRNTQSKLLTYTGATLEVAGAFVDSVAQYPAPEASPQLMVLNLHFALQELRAAAAVGGGGGSGSGNYHGGGNNNGGGAAPGPRVMICGEKDSGKTTVTRTLAALATRAGGQPMVGSVDPREGMLALPGTVSAAVFGTVMDVEDPAAGFGVSGTPSSGPSAVPVKLPMVYYVGRERVDEDVPLWRDLVGKLGSSVRAKFAADEVVREAGLLLDTPAASVAKGDLEILTHVVNEFAGELSDAECATARGLIVTVNIVVVLGSVDLHAELQRRFENQRTMHGEAITLILLDKSDGVAERDKDFMKFTREAAIKEYFFGDAKRTLSPFTQSVSFDDVAVFRTPDGRVLSSSQLWLQLTVTQLQVSTTTNQPLSVPKSQRRCPTGPSL